MSLPAWTNENVETVKVTLQEAVAGKFYGLGNFSHSLTSLITVTPCFRDYLRTLSRLGRNPRFSPFVEDKPVRDSIDRILQLPDISVVPLHGAHGSGKAVFAQELFRRIRHSPGRSTHVAYFAFDAGEHRVHPVSSLLIKIILQLLMNEPELMSNVQELFAETEMSLTENHLWTQLRQLVHKTQKESIHLVMDSLDECSTEGRSTLLKSLVDLQIAALGRLKIWYTSTKCMEFSLPDPVIPVCVHLSSFPELKQYKLALQLRMVDELVTANPKLMVVRQQVEEYLVTSEGVLHSELLAYRAGKISIMSQPKSLNAELTRLAHDWQGTIIGIVTESPTWVIPAVAWILFTRRPLKCMELAVAFSLSDRFPQPIQIDEFDESLIPRDIGGDLVQHLGPLISVDQGAVRISHPFVREILQEWLGSTARRPKSTKRLMTEYILQYLLFCLRRVGPTWDDRGGSHICFSFLGYCLENWHIHYREVVESATELTQLPGNAFHHLVFEVVRMAQQTLSSRPHNHYVLEPQLHRALYLESSNASSSLTANKVDLRQGLLAARLGLFDLVAQHFVPDSDEGKTAMLRIACENDHAKIAEYFAGQVHDASVLDDIFSTACDRGNAIIVKILLARILNLSPQWRIPYDLLLSICKKGQVSVAEHLFQTDTKLDDVQDHVPSLIHIAVDEGLLSLLDLLIKRGFDLNHTDEKGWTPLQRSISKRYYLISHRILREDGLVDDLNDDSLNSTHLAARVGDVDILRKVLKLPRSKSTVETEAGITDLPRSPLHEAAIMGHLEAVQFLLQNDAPLDVADSSGSTALFYALSNNHANVAELLFVRGAKIKFSGVYVNSALQQAVKYGNLAATRRLLKSGGYPNGDDSVDHSPLTDAARSGDIRIFRCLLDFAATDVDKKVNNGDAEAILDEETASGWAAIHFAAYYGHTEITRLLIERDPSIVSDVTRSGHTPLHLAVFRGELDVASVLLSRAEIDVTTGAPLAFDAQDSGGTLSGTEDGDAAEHNNLERQSLRKPQPPFAEYASEILTDPITNQTGHVVSEVLFEERQRKNSIDSSKSGSGSEQTAHSRGAEVDAFTRKHRTALHIAASNGCADLTDLLLRNGATADVPDDHGMRPLHFAATSSVSHALEELLFHGADLAAVDQEGRSPLHCAVQEGTVDAMWRLLKHNADTEAVDGRGCTALHTLIQHVRSNARFFLLLLLDHGANPNSVDNRRMTPLHQAAMLGLTSIVELLVHNGADVNTVDYRDMTPLQRAVLDSESETVRMLLDLGSDPNVPDDEGDTAIIAAILVDNVEILQCLLQRDGQGSSKYAVDINVRNNSGSTPLLLAARRHSMIQQLVEHGADVSACDDDGFTILHKLADTSRGNKSDIDDVDCVLSHTNLKEDLDRRTKGGLTPMHLAARSGDAKMVKALRKQGARIDIQDHQGRTAMHFSVRKMYKDDLQDIFGHFLRLNHANDVNIPDKDEWLPLHWACKGSQEGVIALLLSVYNDPTKELYKQCKFGWTALDIIRFHRMDHVLFDDSPERVPWKPEPVEKNFVVPGTRHGYGCDDCEYIVSSFIVVIDTKIRYLLLCSNHGLIQPMYGIRYKCRSHADFDLCFKCYWHHSKTHYPPDHEFESFGQGPTQGPVYLSEVKEVLSRRGSSVHLNTGSTISSTGEVFHRSHPSSRAAEIDDTINKNQSRRILASQRRSKRRKQEEGS